MGVLAQGLRYPLFSAVSQQVQETRFQSWARARIHPSPRRCISFRLWAGGAHPQEPRAQDLPHASLRQEQGAGDVPLLVLHEETQQGQEEWWLVAGLQRALRLW